MRHLITCILTSLAMLFILHSSAIQVHAAPLTFEFTGVWNFTLLPNGPVQPGDTFRGSFFYDPDTAVMGFQRSGGVSGQVTDYGFSPGGAGIELHVNTATGLVTFRSDASAMTGEVMDDFADEGSLPIDRFYLQSFSLAVLPSAYERNAVRFYIDLVDFDLALVKSSAPLPTTLQVPLNSDALVGLQGGVTLGNLDYAAVGVIQTVTAITSFEQYIDIKPGSDTNPINPKEKGNIPVAILTTATFDATTVDPRSVEFGPHGAREAHGRGHRKDVNGDGKLDLLLHFNVEEMGIRCGDTSASLRGETFGGQTFGGTDAIKTVGCK